MTPDNEENQSQQLKTEQTKALEHLKELLSALNAKDYRERVTDIFCAFLLTDKADYKPNREEMMTLHYELVNFFTKLNELPLIDRFRN